MNYLIDITTGPAVEPVTVQEVKDHCHISHNVEDSLLSTWIKSAREKAEEYHKKYYLTQNVKISFDGFPCLPYVLPVFPVQSVESIKYVTCEGVEVTMLLTDFIISFSGKKCRIAHGHNKLWPIVTLRSIDSFAINTTVGYGSTAAAVPAKVKDAIMLYCAWRSDNREAENSFPDFFYNLLRSDRYQ